MYVCGCLPAHFATRLITLLPPAGELSMPPSCACKCIDHIVDSKMVSLRADFRLLSSECLFFLYETAQCVNAAVLLEALFQTYYSNLRSACRLLFVFDFTNAKLGSNLTGLKGACGRCFQNFRSLAESAAQSLEGIGRASTAMRCLANSMTGRCASAEHAFETAMKTSNKK